MRQLTIKNTVLGSGQPKIIVPLTGQEAVTILAEAAAVWSKSACDIMEWRIDYFEDLQQPEKIVEVANQLSDKITQPLIISLRTAEEGGEAALSPQAYFDIYKYVIENATFDVIDIQLQTPEEIRNPLVDVAHAHGLKVIMSYHNFAMTPTPDEMTALIKEMIISKADIAKIAVMPNDQQDVLDLLSVTAAMRDQDAVLLITMAMGDLGKITRVSGEIFGSAATFGVAVNNSAPGQLPMEKLKEILDIYSDLLV